MGKKWCGTLLVFILLLSIASVSAASPWDVSTSDIKNEVRQGEDAAIQLSIINNDVVDETFRLSVDTLNFAVRSDPPSDFLSSMTVPARDVKSTILYFRPLGQLDPSIYQLPVIITAKKQGTSKTEFVFVRIRSDQPDIRDYFAAVDRILKIPAQVDPRKPIPVEINLKNRNPKNITSLVIVLRSAVASKTIETSLRPLESKVVTTQIELDPLTPPQDDFLTLQLEVGNQTIFPIIKEPFSIISYSELDVKDTPAPATFLSHGLTKIATNRGNVEKTYTLEQKTTFLDTFFTSSDPQAYTINKDDATYLAWDIKLGPNETRSVRATTSYIPLFVILLILIVSVIAYFLFRSPVTISKEASVLSTREGGIAKMKVLIHVKNRSGKAFDKVTIVDKIPNIVEIDKEGEVGTIKPTRVFQNPREGTTIKWEIGSLEKYEERLITYKIHSKLTILGGINLPPSMVTFSDAKGKENISKSNRLDVSI